MPEQRLLVGVCVSGESDVGVSDPGSGPRAARRLQISGPVCSNCEIVFPGVQKSKGPASIQYYYVVNVRSCVRYLHCTRVLVTRDPSLGLGVIPLSWAAWEQDRECERLQDDVLVHARLYAHALQLPVCLRCKASTGIVTPVL